MEKRLIIVLLVPLLMFFKWFDPIVRENEKGEKAYHNRKYKEALNHFKIARDRLSVSDSYRSEVNRIINKLDGMSSYLKKIKGESLNISDINEKYKKQLISEFKSLSKGLNRFSDITSDYSEKNSYNDLKDLSKKIVGNVMKLSKKIVETFAKNGSGEIGGIYKDIAYTKSQIELYNSKIGTAGNGEKRTPDLEALRYNIASSYYELSDFQNAKNEFEKINPDGSLIKRSDLFFDLGNTHFKMKSYEKALELYKKSLREDPEDIEARQNYELTLEMLKKQKKKKKDKEKKENKNKDKDKKDQQKDQKKDKEEEKKEKKQDKQDKNKKEEDKKKDKEEKKDREDKQEKKENKKDEQKDKQKKNEKPEAKPEQKHRNMLQFIDQNEKKQMKKMLQKNKLLKYGIKKSKKKRKDW